MDPQRRRGQSDGGAYQDKPGGWVDREQSVTAACPYRSKIVRVVLVGLLSLLGLSVIGVGAADAATAATIKSLTPATGGTAGGTSVVIAGTGFGSSAGSVTVTFAGVPATSFTLNSGTKITAVSPPAAIGSAPAAAVVVTVSGTPSTPVATGDNIFTYTPSVSGTGLIPATSTQTGSTVTVTAAGTWTVGQQVSIAGWSNGLTSGVYSVVTGGSGSFTIAFPGNTSGAGSGSVSPTLNGAVGSVSGGTSVVINGAGFTGATAVHFGATAATSFTVNSATQITAVAPAGTGSVDITVTSSTASTSVIVPADDTFNYVTTPTVTGLTTTATPAGGPTGGGTQVTVSGTSFDKVSAVDFGGTPATSFLLNGLNSITAVAPAGTGTVDVTVTTGLGTSATGSADQYVYNPTLAAAAGSAAYTNSPGTSVPVTGTSQSGTTLTIDAIGSWTAGQKVGLSGFTNGLPAATYTVVAPVTGVGFTVTVPAGTTTGTGTGNALVLATVSATAVSATTTGTGTVTLTAPGAWYVGQKVYLTGFTNGITTGDYAVTVGGNGHFGVPVTGNVTASGTGSVIPFQAQSFNVATQVTGGGTIDPASVTVTNPPASGTVEVEGTQLVHIPAQSDPTSYSEGATTVWLTHVTTTGSQTVTYSICDTSPTCTTGTVTYNPGNTGLYVGNQLNAIGLLVSVVEDTGGGVVAPPTAAQGSTFTTVTSPTPTNLPSVDVLPVIGIGGYRSITPVPSGVTLVPGSLSVTGGDALSTGKYTSTLCTQAMGYVPNVCTANVGSQLQVDVPLCRDVAQRRNLHPRRVAAEPAVGLGVVDRDRLLGIHQRLPDGIRRYHGGAVDRLPRPRRLPLQPGLLPHPGARSPGPGLRRPESPLDGGRGRRHRPRRPDRGQRDARSRLGHGVVDGAHRRRRERHHRLHGHVLAGWPHLLRHDHDVLHGERTHQRHAVHLHRHGDQRRRYGRGLEPVHPGHSDHGARRPDGGDGRRWQRLGLGVLVGSRLRRR